MTKSYKDVILASALEIGPEAITQATQMTVTYNTVTGATANNSSLWPAQNGDGPHQILPTATVDSFCAISL